MWTGKRIAGYSGAMVFIIATAIGVSFVLGVRIEGFNVFDAIPGSSILIIGILLLVVFRTQVDKKRIEPFDEERRREKEKREAEKGAKKFEELVISATDTEKDLEEVRRRRLDVVAHIKKPMRFITGLFKGKEGEKQPETTGGLLDRIKETRGEGIEESFQEFRAKIDKQSVSVDKLVNSCSKECSDIESQVNSMRSMMNQLSVNLSALGDARVEYRGIVEKGKVSEEAERISELESEIRRVLQHELSDSRSLKNASAKITKLSHKMSDNMKKIRATAYKISQQLRDVDKKKEYNEIVERVKNLSKEAASLWTELSENKGIIDALRDELRDVRDDIIRARDTQLAAQREIHEAMAAEDEQTIARLGKAVHELQEESTDLKQEVSSLNDATAYQLAVIDQFNGPVESLQRYLNEARADAKTDTELEENVSFSIQRLLSEKIPMAASLRTVLEMLKEEMRKREDEAKNARERSQITLEMQNSLIGENERLTQIKSAAEEEIKNAKNEINDLQKQLKEKESELSKATAENEAEITASIDKIKRRIYEVNNQFKDASAALQSIPTRKATIKEEIKELEIVLAQISPEVTRLQQESQKSRSRLEEIKNRSEEADKENKRIIEELEDRNSQIKKESDVLVRSLQMQEAELRDLRQALQDKSSEIEDLRTKKEQDIEKIKTLKEKAEKAVEFERLEEEKKKEISEFMETFRKAQEDKLNNYKSIIRKQLEEISNLSSEVQLWKEKVQAEEYAKEALTRRIESLNIEIEANKKKIAETPPEAKELDVLNAANVSLQEKIDLLEKELKESKKRSGQAVAYAQETERKEKELLDKSEKTKQEYEIAIAELKKEIQSSSVMIQDITSDLDTYKGQAQKLQMEIDSVAQSNLELQEQLIGAQQALESARGTDEELKRTEERNAILQQQLENLKTEKQDTQKLAKSRDEIANKYGRLIIEHKRLINEIESEKEAHKAEIEDKHKEIERISEETERLRTRIDNLMKAKELTKHIPEDSDKVRQLRTVLEDYEKKKKDLEQEIIDKNDILNNAEKLIDDLNVKLESANQRSAALEQEAAEAKKASQKIDFQRWFIEEVDSFRIELVKARSMMRNKPDTARDRANKVLGSVQTIVGMKFLDITPEKITNMITPVINECNAIIHEAVVPRAAPPTIPEKALEKIPKVIAVGDPHGDYKVFKNVLVKAGIIDENEKWTAHHTTKVVLLGDYLDRGPEIFDVLELIHRLKRKAGDKLVLLMGNHEAMFLGAFDWEGYDNTSNGKKEMARYKKMEDLYLKKVAEEKSKQKRSRAELSEKAIRSIRKSIVLGKGIMSKDKIDYDTLYLKVELIKEKWFLNETKHHKMPSAMFQALGIAKDEVWNDNVRDALSDPRILLDKTYHNIRVREHVEFMRDNLEISYEERGILFIHAGIPYHVKDPASQQERDHEFVNFVIKDELKGVLNKIAKATKKRMIEYWMACSEMSPFFAGHPMRKYEWNEVPGESAEAEVAKQGYDAIVHGHTYHDPIIEQKHVKLYKKNPRKTYNIDFGMSRGIGASGLSYGGWLEVYDKGVIKVQVIYKDKSKDLAEVEPIEYKFKYQ
jgi:chromosome segregation ATPase